MSKDDHSQFSLMTEQAVGALISSSRLCATVFVADRSFTLALPSSGVFVMGRGADADLQLPSTQVSRRHAQLTLDADGERGVIVDLKSRNGTLVNGIPIDAERAIAHGDEVTAGDVRILFLRRSSVPVDALVLMPKAVFLEQLASDVARASIGGTRLWVLALELPQRWHEAVAARRELEVLPRVGYYGILADNIIGIAAPHTEEHEALSIEEMLVKAMQRANIHASVGMVAARRGASASDIVDEVLDAVARSEAPPAKDATNAPVALAPAMVAVLDHARQLARSSLPILLIGETGAGKEVLARFIHQASGRTGPLVSVNAAALPDALLESELFGHERGAFSGAAQAKVGLIEAAHKGSLFLDEIGELPLSMQAKLLRVLEDQLVRRVGATTDRQVDVRFISATNRNLEEGVRAREFRQDLLFRLNAGVVQIPPLRERREEIPALAQLFLARGAAARGLPPAKISEAALALLTAYDWPGNVRELRNVMDRALALSEGATVAPKHLPEALERASQHAPVSQPLGRPRPIDVPPATIAPPPISSNLPLPRPPPQAEGPMRDQVAHYEREQIERALQEAGGNQTRAAALLGMPRRTLAYRMARLGIRLPTRDE